MEKLKTFLTGFEAKLNNILSPKILRIILVSVESFLLFLAFLFCAIGIGLLDPVFKWEHGYTQWFDFYLAELIFAIIFVGAFVAIFVLAFVNEKIGNMLSLGFHVFGLVMFILLALLGIGLIVEGDRDSSFRALSYYRNSYEITLMTDIEERTKALEKLYEKIETDYEKMEKLAETFGCEFSVAEVFYSLKTMNIQNTETRGLKQQMDKYEGEKYECLNTFESTHLAFLIISDIIDFALIFITAFGTFEGLMRVMSTGSSGESSPKQENTQQQPPAPVEGQN